MRPVDVSVRCSVYYRSVFYFVSVFIVFVVIIVCLQIEMCKRSHDACKKNVPRDHEVG